jgi:hypothetical protein
VKTLLLPILIVCIASASAAAQVNKRVRKEHLTTKWVEVSPGDFAPVREYSITWDLADGSFEAVHTLEIEPKQFYHKDTTYLLVRGVQWVGVGVPISLRVHDDKLHLIVFDRDTDFDRIRFRYFREKEKVLTEIEPKDYPKSIATQNLWLRTEDILVNTKPFNELATALALDPADPHFRRSLTAKVWRQLEKGTEYYEDRDGDVDQKLLEEYLRRNNVQRLTKIAPERRNDRKKEER